ncbi:MAG: hypothetical protein KAT77_05885 [Nanoarchaeota archaeon]|nr:hypothetical protein [Nanoarchaeota archaeon]
MKKRLFGLLTFFLLSIFFISLFSTSVFAQDKDIGSTLTDSLGWIGQIDLSKVGAGDIEATFWAKVLMWFTVFTIFYFAGTRTIFQDQKRLAGILAAIIGMFVIFIPADMFKQLFQTYQIVFLVIMYGLPLVGMILGLHALKTWVGEEHPKAYHISAFILTLLVMFVMAQLEQTLTFFAGIEGLFQFRNWISFAYAFLHIFLIYQLVMIFVAKKEGEDEEEGAVSKWLTKTTKLGDMGKKIRAFWRPEYKAGRTLRRITKKMERASKTIIEALEALMEGLEGLKENPENEGAKKTITESINKIIPAIREEVAAKENFETLKARLLEWKTGQMQIAKNLKTTLQEMPKLFREQIAENEAKIPKAADKEKVILEKKVKFMKEKLLPEIEDDVKGDVEIVDTELKILEGEMIDLSKAEKIIEVIETILPITVANLKKIEEHVKEAEYNEGYVLAKETLKNEKIIEKDYEIVLDIIQKIRIMISAERKELKKIMRKVAGGALDDYNKRLKGKIEEFKKLVT